MKLERSALLVDGSNFYETGRLLNRQIDYSKLIDWVYNHNTLPMLLHAYYFTALPDKEEHSNVRRLVDYLDYNGYICVTKETSQYTNGDNVRIKGNMDMDMAVKAIKLAPTVSDIILATGDGDFVPVVDYLQDLGVKVTVLSTLKNRNGHGQIISNNLRRQCDDFVDIETLDIFKD